MANNVVTRLHNERNQELLNQGRHILKLFRFPGSTATASIPKDQYGMDSVFMNDSSREAAIALTSRLAALSEVMKTEAIV
jgi:hypothetical protein